MKLRDLYLKINPAQGSTDGIGYTDQIFIVTSFTEKEVTLQTKKDNYSETINIGKFQNEFIELETFIATSRWIYREGSRSKPIVNLDESIDCSFYKKQESNCFLPIDRFCDSYLVLSFLSKDPLGDRFLKYFPKEKIVKKIQKDLYLKQIQEKIDCNSNKKYVVLCYNQNHMLIYQIDSGLEKTEGIVIVPKKYLDFNWVFSKYCTMQQKLPYYKIPELISEKLLLEEPGKAYVKER